MLTKLSVKEKKVWRHITAQLEKYGMIRLTDGMLITVICRTYCEWVDATDELALYKEGNGGSYIMESANGHLSPHPLYFIIRDLKKSLLQWLPEAGLTMQGFQKVRAAQIAERQGLLFDDRDNSGLQIIFQSSDNEL